MLKRESKNVYSLVHNLVLVQKSSHARYSQSVIPSFKRNHLPQVLQIYSTKMVIHMKNYLVHIAKPQNQFSSVHLIDWPKLMKECKECHNMLPNDSKCRKSNINYLQQ